MYVTCHVMMCVQISNNIKRKKMLKMRIVDENILIEI